MAPFLCLPNEANQPHRIEGNLGYRKDAAQVKK